MLVATIFAAKAAILQFSRDSGSTLGHDFFVNAQTLIDLDNSSECMFFYYQAEAFENITGAGFYITESGTSPQYIYETWTGNRTNLLNLKDNRSITIASTSFVYLNYTTFNLSSGERMWLKIYANGTASGTDKLRFSTVNAISGQNVSNIQSYDMSSMITSIGVLNNGCSINSANLTPGFFIVNTSAGAKGNANVYWSKILIISGRVGAQDFFVPKNLTAKNITISLDTSSESCTLNVSIINGSTYNFNNNTWPQNILTSCEITALSGINSCNFTQNVSLVTNKNYSIYFTSNCASPSNGKAPTYIMSVTSLLPYTFQGSNYKARYSLDNGISWSDPDADYAFKMGVTLPNTAPNTTNASISPTSAFANTTLQGFCIASDVDGDTLSYNYKWFLNQIENNSGTRTGYAPDTLVNIANISFSNVSKNQNWTFSCQVNDTQAIGIWINSSVLTIQNSLPNVTLVTITPSGVIERDDPLGFSNTTTDLDNDAIISWVVLWWKNGAVQNSLENQSIVGIGNLTLGDNWTVSLQAFDGQNYSTFRNSTSIFINDSTKPNLSLDSLSASSGTNDAAFNIFVDYYDYNNVSSVLVEVTDPNNASANFSMTLNSGIVSNGTYLKAYTPSTDGVYGFKFYGIDTYNNMQSLISNLSYTESTFIPPPSGGGGGGSLSIVTEEACGFEILQPSGINPTANSLCSPGGISKSLFFSIYNTIGEPRTFEYSIDSSSCKIKPSTQIVEGNTRATFELYDCICPDEAGLFKEYNLLIKQGECTQSIKVTTTASRLAQIISNPAPYIFAAILIIGFFVGISAIFYYWNNK